LYRKPRGRGREAAGVGRERLAGDTGTLADADAPLQREQGRDAEEE